MISGRSVLREAAREGTAVVLTIEEVLKKILQEKECYESNHNASNLC